MDKAEVIQLQGTDRSRLLMKGQEGLKPRDSPIVMRFLRDKVSAVCLAAPCLGCHHLEGQERSRLAMRRTG